MPRKRYFFRPPDSGLDTSAPSLHLPANINAWPMKNVDIDRRSIMKPWGYNTADRTLNNPCLNVGMYEMISGTRHTMYLTEADLCQRETAAGKTYSFKTDTGDYDDSVYSVFTDTVTLKAATVADTEDIVAGDFFVLDADDLTADVELDSNWAEIESVTTAGGFHTVLTLTGTYPGTRGSWGGIAAWKDMIIRRVYTTPSDDWWSTAVVDDKFCFTNLNTSVQYWDGADYAEDLDAGLVAHKARFCKAYANRLVIADYGSTRNPIGMAWSKEDDPTDWTDSTAGTNTFLDSGNRIMGLSRVGQNLVVLREDSVVLAYQTGLPTAPIGFQKDKFGIGCRAPYSSVEFLGFCAFRGQDDFYMIEADQPISIGEKVRPIWEDIVEENEAKYTYGFAVPDYHKTFWRVNTTEGKKDFVWDWKTRDWSIREFGDQMVSGGMGVI